MSDQGGSGVNVVAIIAILVLVGVAGWWFTSQRSTTPPIQNTQTTETAPSSTQPAPAQEAPKTDINVNVPDTVTVQH